MDYDSEEVKDLLKAIDLHVRAGFVALVTLAHMMQAGRHQEPFPSDIAENAEFIDRIADSLRTLQTTETR
jgi:hypothetical protein